MTCPAFTPIGHADARTRISRPAPLPRYTKLHDACKGRQMRAELMNLLDGRPKSGGNRFLGRKERRPLGNGDYLYGKKRLREIDRRIRHPDDAPARHRRGGRSVGAPCRARPGLLRCDGDLCRHRRGKQRTITIKGIDESDSLARRGQLDLPGRAGAAEGARGRRGDADDASGAAAPRGDRGALSRPGEPA